MALVLFGEGACTRNIATQAASCSWTHTGAADAGDAPGPSNWLAPSADLSGILSQERGQMLWFAGASRTSRCLCPSTGRERCLGKRVLSEDGRV